VERPCRLPEPVALLVERHLLRPPGHGAGHLRQRLPPPGVAVDGGAGQGAVAGDDPLQVPPAAGAFDVAHDSPSVQALTWATRRLMAASAAATSTCRRRARPARSTDVPA